MQFYDGRFLSLCNRSPELYKLWLSPGNTPVPGVKGPVSETRQADKVFRSAFQREPLVGKVASVRYLLLLKTSSLYTVKLIHACSHFL